MTNLQSLLSRSGVKWILIANLIAFPIGFVIGGEHFNTVGLIPGPFMAKLGSLNLIGCFADLIRYQFFHIGFTHIFMNMLFLMAVGLSLETSLGCWHFLLLYVATGIIAGLAFVLVSPHLPLMVTSGAISDLALEKCLQFSASAGIALEKCLQSGMPLIGSSGAIAGLMGAALVITREQPMLDLPILNFTIKAKHFIVAWLLWQIHLLYAAIGNPQAAEFVVHISGLAAGFAIARYWKSRMTDTASPTNFGDSQ